MLRLENPIQPYPWGSVTALPALLGVAPTGAPQAELWLGAHPSAPSRVQGRSLEAIIAEAPDDLLGPAVVRGFGPHLPFLLKVLAAAQPLSLQAHPTRAQAEAGYAREDAEHVPLSSPTRTWRDRNHKPELLCALTPFRALCGFRRVQDTQALLTALAVPSLEPLLTVLRDGGLEPFFHRVMTWPEPGPLVGAVVEACARRPVEGFRSECATAVELCARYPGDAGVIGALLLNLVTLQPFEALALGAGTLHAYLEGTGVELMANSDNVLRGGLTRKHVDVPALLEVLDFSSGPAAVLTATGSPEAIFVTPFPEFQLSKVTVTTPFVTTRRGPDVLLCLDGAVTVNGLALQRGQSAFVPFAEGPLTWSGHGMVFRATVNA